MTRKRSPRPYCLRNSGMICCSVILLLSDVGNCKAEGGTFRVTSSAPYGYLPIRSGPGLGHSIVVKIRAGTGGIRLGTCQAGDDERSQKPWCTATWNGYFGWISTCRIAKSQETPPDQTLNSTPRIGEPNRSPELGGDK